MRQICCKSYQSRIEKKLGLLLSIEVWEKGLKAIFYQKITQEFNICWAIIQAWMAVSCSLEQFD